MQDHQFSFHLPFHKADCFYQGGTIVIMKKEDSHLDPMLYMHAYLEQQDKLFPYHPELWLTIQGTTLTYSSWCVSKLKSILGTDVGGHSIWSGAATTLTLEGVPCYFRRNKYILSYLLHGIYR
jgi:hypothetical protein